MQIQTPGSKRQSGLGAFRDRIAFRLKPPHWPDILTDELTFGTEANDRFRSLVQSSTTYLEFGSGSSTLHAAAAGGSFVSIDSDAGFLSAVTDMCNIEPRAHSEGTFVAVDIGRTGPWGVPSRRRANPRRVAKWAEYPMAPWNTMGKNFRADVVLVDGRFRVACGLAVVVMQADADWTLLFDDFADRSEYEPMREFATLVAMHGRMAEFRPAPSLDHSSARSAFDEYAGDWR